MYTLNDNECEPASISTDTVPEEKNMPENINIKAVVPPTASKRLTIDYFLAQETYNRYNIPSYGQKKTVFNKLTQAKLELIQLRKKILEEEMLQKRKVWEFEENECKKEAEFKEKECKWKEEEYKLKFQNNFQ